MNRAIPFLLLLALAPTPAQALDRDCFRRIRLAEGAGFIKSYRSGGDHLEVVVAENIWTTLSAPSRQGLVTTLNCALRREGRPFARIQILSDATKDILGEALGETLTTIP